ncbi:hypothetical protein P8918_13165 [Bacillus spizizenii]|nr:hypothetical protein [Bacillus spizizenii]MCY8890521.1 hypothetical protein [Bacillus spizizenii]MEC0841976.1 hypothetical protein [Bacillus spizizenii]
MTYFKSDFHEQQTNLLLKKLGRSTVTEDLEYGVFAYVTGATLKAEKVEQAIDGEGVDIEKLYEIIDVFSSSEKAMIRFALQCFNSSIDDIKLSEVMRSLDDQNTQVVKQAINILY